MNAPDQQLALTGGGTSRTQAQQVPAPREPEPDQADRRMADQRPTRRHRRDIDDEERQR